MLHISIFILFEYLTLIHILGKPYIYAQDKLGGKNNERCNVLALRHLWWQIFISYLLDLMAVHSKVTIRREYFVDICITYSKLELEL